MTAAGVGPLHGGPRLQPEHYEPRRVPPAVSSYGSAPDTLLVGSPGKVGVLELTFELRGDGDRRRTELVRHYQKTPLQIMRPLYYDVSRPDMPYTFLMTTGGGVLHGDRQRTDLVFGPGTSAHITTQAHTKLYRMANGYATAVVNIDVGPDAYVEYLPDPTILYAASRFYQHTDVTLDDSSTLLYGETIYAGRLSRGERNEYDVYASDLEISRPDGRPVVIDRVRLAPAARAVDGPAVLGDRDIVSSMYVVSPLTPAAELAERMHLALDATLDDDAHGGVSVLPDDCGAWARIVGDDTVSIAAAGSALWNAAREVLTGAPAPAIRK